MTAIFEKKPWASVVTSSNGNLIIDKRTGVILQRMTYYEPEQDEDARGLMKIVVFDVDEYYAYWGTTPEATVGFDILDLGYTYVNDNGTTGFEEPAHNWRLEISSRTPAHSKEPELIQMMP